MLKEVGIIWLFIGGSFTIGLIIGLLIGLLI